MGEKEKLIKAPEPEKELGAPTDELKLESTPKELELESVPAPAELPAAPVLEALPKPKKSKKGLVVALVVVLMLAGLAVAIYFMFFNKPVEKTDTKKEDTSQEKPKEDEAVTTNTTKYLTYTTKHNKLQFDYPEDWKVSEEVKDQQASGEARHYTYLTMPTGKKLVLVEDQMGGIGGICEPDEAPRMQVHKEAGTKIAGVTIVSYTQPQSGEFSLHTSIYSGSYDTPVSLCSVGYDRFIQSKLSTDDALVSFYYDSTDRPVTGDFEAIVKALASLRQSK